MKAKDFEVCKLGKATIPSPIDGLAFVDDKATVLYERDASGVAAEIKRGEVPPAFEMAGVRRKIFHDPAWSKAAILTAGGLCPGLNEVIRALTFTLIDDYNVPVVYGIKYGYKGLNPANHLDPIILNKEVVDDIHSVGGTILGSSRGAEDPAVMVDTLVRMSINMLFCIGGDGTARGAHALVKEIKKRKLSISVIAIPKTIDNDLSYIDRSFGFATAILAAGSFISGAHCEARGAYNGIGLIKVMGRDSGWIAAVATLANPYVNFCLVPEEKFTLEDGPHALLPALKERLEKRHHAVIIVAEGAGQELIGNKDKRRDASGNVLHDDIGLFLKSEILDYMKREKMDVTLKYFDPGYAIRSVSAVGEDSVFCALLATSAVHAAMAGRTDMMVGHWGGAFTHVPIELVTSERKKIRLDSPLWNCVKTHTCF
ncbi:MAG: ATP-dependent 6-phosphofructokinase [Victivallaceae bacterium]|nr:ATP-dependent 6-phosphofructokinase [Victivallaceae bacterium]